MAKQPDDKPTPEKVTPDKMAVESIPSIAGGLSALASANAPFIYCDGAPNFGANNGIINVTLEAVRFTPLGTGIATDRVSVAHLRMSIPAARLLKTALESALLLAAPAESNERN